VEKGEFEMNIPRKTWVIGLAGVLIVVVGLALNPKYPCYSWLCPHALLTLDKAVVTHFRTKTNKNAQGG
jgi:hypothetical protein